MKLSDRSSTNLTERQYQILEFHLNSVNEINEFTIDLIEEGLHHDFYWGIIKDYKEYLRIRAAFCDVALNHFKQ